jgi:hypothetical protein
MTLIVNIVALKYNLLFRQRKTPVVTDYPVIGDLSF